MYINFILVYFYFYSYRFPDRTSNEVLYNFEEHDG